MVGAFVLLPPRWVFPGSFLGGGYDFFDPPVPFGSALWERDKRRDGISFVGRCVIGEASLGMSGEVARGAHESSFLFLSYGDGLVL